VITVVGTPAWRTAEPPGPAGRACEIALAAAAVGSRVELVGRIGDDPAGDALLLALARASIGHAAVLRDPARPTALAGPPAEPEDDDPFADPEPSGPADGMPRPAGPRLQAEDVALGLRYLTGFDVLVLTDDAPPPVLPVAIDAAAFAGARLVVLAAAGTGSAGTPETALVLEVPACDDGAFGSLVGSLAAGLDRGLAVPDALRAAAGAGGWEAVSDAT
jgi:hypothetical protein